MPTDLLNTLMVALQVFLAMLGGFLVAFHLSMVIWTFRDIRSRSRDAFAHLLATALVFFFSLPGLLLYLILRPRETLAEQYERALEEEALLQDIEERLVCPGCQRKVEPDFMVCPSCHTQLKVRCAHCGRLLHPKWTICPYCATPVAPPPPEPLTPGPEVAAVEPPEPLRPAAPEAREEAPAVAVVASSEEEEAGEWQPEVAPEGAWASEEVAPAPVADEEEGEEVPEWVRAAEEEAAPAEPAAEWQADTAPDDGQTRTDPFPEWVWPQDGEGGSAGEEPSAPAEEQEDEDEPAAL